MAEDANELEKKIASMEQTLNLIVDLLTDSGDETEKEEITEKEEVNNSSDESVEDKKKNGFFGKLFGKKEEEKENEEDIDKRANIDDVGGFLKSKGLTDEDIRYVMKLMEKNSYENEADKEEEVKKNEEKKEEEIVENEEEKEPEKDVKLNRCIKKNSLSLLEKRKKEIKKNSIDSEYKLRKERIAETNKKFYID